MHQRYEYGQQTRHEEDQVGELAESLRDRDEDLLELLDIRQVVEHLQTHYHDRDGREWPDVVGQIRYSVGEVQVRLELSRGSQDGNPRKID